MTHPAAITTSIITDGTIYNPGISTKNAAIAAAEKAITKYLETHFAEQTNCHHVDSGIEYGKNSDNAAEIIVERVIEELDDDHRFDQIDTEHRGWSNVAIDITARAGVILAGLWSGKTPIEEIHVCDYCGSDTAREDAWSASTVRL